MIVHVIFFYNIVYYPLYVEHSVSHDKILGHVDKIASVCLLGCSPLLSSPLRRCTPREHGNPMASCSRGTEYDHWLQLFIHIALWHT